jgi:hypothetical protein
MKDERCRLERIESKRVFSTRIAELTPLVKNSLILPKFHT